MPNGVWDYLEIVEFVTEAVATQSSRPQDYVFIPFNEADGGNWYNNWGALKDTFLGDSRWQPERSADYLDYALANDVMPEIFIWHELGIENLATFRSHLAEYRAIEAERGIDPLLFTALIVQAVGIAMPVIGGVAPRF